MDLDCLYADGGVDGFDGGDDNLVVITIIMQNKHTVVLPLPTSQTIFTFTLPLGSSVLLQTSECSECHPFAQSQVVSALSLTKLQQHGTNSPLLSVTHPLSVPSDLSSVPLP